MKQPTILKVRETSSEEIRYAEVTATGYLIRTVFATDEPGKDITGQELADGYEVLHNAQRCNETSLVTSGRCVLESDHADDHHFEE